MKLSAQGQYAVLAMIFIAEVNNQVVLEEGDYKDVKVTINSMVKQLAISGNFLEQICLKLKKAGLLFSTRGAKGGYFLAKSKYEITIFEILKAVDIKISNTKCDGNKNCLSKQGEKAKICRSHYMWSGLENIIRSYLTKITIADLLNVNCQIKVRDLTREFLQCNLAKEEQCIFAKEEMLTS